MYALHSGPSRQQIILRCGPLNSLWVFSFNSLSKIAYLLDPQFEVFFLLLTVPVALNLCAILTSVAIQMKVIRIQDFLKAWIRLFFQKNLVL